MGYGFRPLMDTWPAFVVEKKGRGDLPGEHNHSQAAFKTIRNYNKVGFQAGLLLVNWQAKKYTKERTKQVRTSKLLPFQHTLQSFFGFIKNSRESCAPPDFCRGCCITPSTPGSQGLDTSCQNLMFYLYRACKKLTKWRIIIISQTVSSETKFSLKTVIIATFSLCGNNACLRLYVDYNCWFGGLYRGCTY